jgi:hypothetical protein
MRLNKAEKWAPAAFEKANSETRLSMKGLASPDSVPQPYPAATKMKLYEGLSGRESPPYATGTAQ